MKFSDFQGGNSSKIQLDVMAEIPKTCVNLILSGRDVAK
jgi:hypothetical protein